MSFKKFIQVGIASLCAASFLVLTGCASQSLEAPCPDFGKSCNKTPINSWDTSVV